jgi:hypothetical protein
VADHAKSPAGPLLFLDLADGKVFEDHDFWVADREVLLTGIGKADLTSLNARQVRDVEYHRPRTVGDLWFNWFD